MQYSYCCIFIYKNIGSHYAKFIRVLQALSYELISSKTFRGLVLVAREAWPPVGPKNLIDFYY